MSVMGNILEIDLTHESFHFRPYPHKIVTGFLAGRGFNVAYLYKHLDKGIDPLSPLNILVLSCGLLTGLAAPASSRLHVNALSPLTGILGSSNVGGDFGIWLRSAGIQSIIIRGQARRPVTLLIEHDRVIFKDATELWGLDTWHTQEQLESDLGSKTIRSLVIGPAGENGVLYACIMTGRDHAAGRTGMGAVMGFKQVKAIVVRSDSPKPLKISSEGLEAVKSYVKKIMATPDFKIFKKYGGAGYLKWADDQGIMASHNYRENRFEGIERIDGRQLKQYKIKSKGCHRCPVQCKADLSFKDSARGGTVMARPEFEPLINLGPKCGLDDLEALVRIDNLCSQLGLDNISTGGAIAFAMDLYERGLLREEDCGGLQLNWGNATDMEALVWKIANKEGLGEILAQGVRQAAVLIGNNAENFAPHVKGLELAAYHPRAIMGTALGYTVAGRGGDYSNVYAAMEYNWSADKAAAEFGTSAAVDLESTEGKAPLVKRAMIVNAVLDAVGICKVPALSMIGAFDLMDEAGLASAVSNLKLSAAQMFLVGERIINIERLINLRYGATAEDDCLPQMFFRKEYAAGQNMKNPAEKIARMRKLFYEEMGWDSGGRPMEVDCIKRDIDSSFTA